MYFGNGSSTGSSVSYVWDFGDGNSSILFDPNNIYNTMGVYSASLVVFDGACSDTAYVTIEVDGESSLIIPNVFTPNGDNINDVFTIGSSNIETLNCEIYNRWGQKLFETTDPDEGWDGKLKGSKVQNDAYVFYVSFKIRGDEQIVKAGTVMTLR